MALLIVVLTFLRGKGFLQDVVTEEHYHIMGKRMHSFVEPPPTRGAWQD